MKAVLIDDEPHNIENLQLLLQQHCPDIEISGTAANADAGVAMIRQLKPELVFLDIQMPGKNGFDLLQSLTDYDFHIIFVTAFDQFALQAIKFSAIDYLLKPVDPAELRSAVQKAVDKHNERKRNLRVENLLSTIKEGQDRDTHRIALQTQQEIRFVPINSILRCESANNYTRFYLLTGDKIITSRPIYEYEELLNNYGFFRPHQSHLVNKRFLRSFVKSDGGYLVLEDGSQVPVSRAKKEEIRNLF